MMQEPSTQLSKNPCDWFILYDANLPIRETTIQVFANKEEFIFGFGLPFDDSLENSGNFQFAVSDADQLSQLLNALEQNQELTIENVTFSLDSSHFKVILPELNDKNPARTVTYTVEDAQDLIRWGRATLAGEKFVRG